MQSESPEFQFKKDTISINYLQNMCTNYKPYYEEKLINLLPEILECLSDKNLFDPTKKLINFILDKINPCAFELISKHLYNSFESLKFQVKIGALEIICCIVDKYPKIISFNLPMIIEKLISVSNDLKKEVKLQVNTTLIKVCSTIDNVDVKDLIAYIIDAYMNPVTKTELALEKLVSTPFINDIDIPTLGLLIPLLVRAMKEKKVVNQRKAAVVMETLSKLIKNPIYVKMFYDKLIFILNKGIDEIPIEEVRNVCQKSKDTINSVYQVGITNTINSLSLENCKEIFINTIGENIMIDHSIKLIMSLISNEIVDNDLYYDSISPYFENKESVLEIVSKILDTIKVIEYNPEDSETNLCDCMFSLAYGTRVLLHQTPFKVKVGRKYGLVGHNGAGKSTLMKAIANKNLQGFPEELTSIYIEHDIQGNNSETSVLDYVQSDDKINNMNFTNQQVNDALLEIGFLQELINGPVTALSGGWRMRLALSKAMLLKPDMLLLDEPTNHLDQFAVKWLVDYINNLKETTCLIVSHDTKFIDKVCTNIMHYENLKLQVYRGNLSDFVKQKPEAKQYFELTDANLAFNFPDPGPLEGIKSLTKAVLKMKNTYFQYPTASKPQLIDVSLQVSLASRVAVCGVNGAGKSTLIKILVGELEPNTGIIERHPNVRVAYVAQHAFHHIEDHLDKTPIEYIMWRYRGGYDKEATGNEGLTLSPEELEAIKKKAKENKEMVIVELNNRRTGKREHEYEAKYDEVETTQWFTKTELIQKGYEKMIKEKDQQISMESLLGQRKLTTGVIQGHFNNFGLEPHFAQHSKIGSLSGGQKVKVVLGACTFGLPHVIILDEPTNFLDRDSQGALASAIRSFKGGILLISHNSEFYENLCPERWLLDAGSMTTFGSEWMDAVEQARKKKEKDDSKKLNFDQAEDKFDSLGNKIEVKQEKKELSRGDRKQLLKQKKEMEKRGEDTYEIDQLLGVE
jgi:elongation factor 3